MAGATARTTVTGVRDVNREVTAYARARRDQWRSAVDDPEFLPWMAAWADSQRGGLAPRTANHGTWTNLGDALRAVAALRGDITVEETDDYRVTWTSQDLTPELRARRFTQDEMDDARRARNRNRAVREAWTREQYAAYLAYERMLNDRRRAAAR